MPPEDRESLASVVDEGAAEQDENVIEELGDVLPPEDEQAPVKEPAEKEKTAEELAEDLDEDEEEPADEDEDEEEAAPAAAQSSGRVSAASYFMNTYIPQAQKQYESAVKVDKESGEVSIDTSKQFEVIADMANKMLGAVMADQITPHMQQLAVAGITMANELNIRDLREDPEFRKLEPQVRKRLQKLSYQERASDTAVRDIFYRIRGAKKNGKAPAAVTVKPKTAAKPAREALKDLSAAGGASPRPAGIRLTKEQEADYQEMIESGWPGDRKDYYAKYKARVDSAKAQGKAIPKTYR